MPIAPIGAALPVAGVNPTQAINAAKGAEPSASVTDLFTGSLEQASKSQASADEAMRGALTGQADGVTEVMAAMTEAQLATQLTVAVRNRAVESFNEIMRMQI